ncbi:MAG TPA: ParA family partition ATPase [Stellaceae bacterium]|nr:ParA family partition ATPase [Stellaceae bacterium]
MAATVITIAQQKGGAGKTTLAAQLAATWARQGRRLALLDIDPQASLAAWTELRRARLGAAGLGFEFAALSGWRATDWVERHAREVDYVIVDSPPHAELEARIALRTASLVLVPLQPSPLDLWSSATTLRLAREEGRPILAVLNRVPARSSLAETVAAELARDGVTVAAARLGSRVAFAQAMSQGGGVVETAPASPAAAEIAALAAEIAVR